VHLILSRLGRIWFSSATARLTQFGRPRRAETRQRPYIVHAGDGCEVRCYREKVLITLVLVLAIALLAIIRAVTCIYSR